MKKILAAALALVLVLALAVGCGKAPGGGTMTLYTWEGMFPPEVLEAFTKRQAAGTTMCSSPTTTSSKR